MATGETTTIPLRFAILHHTGVAEPHFDLLFESASGSTLAAWRSPAWPITGPTGLQRLPDHRPLYLTYEGPVSQDRGEVRRVLAGEFEPLELGPDCWRLRLHPDGPVLQFQREGQGDRWTASARQTD